MGGFIWWTSITSLNFYFLLDPSLSEQQIKIRNEVFKVVRYFMLTLLFLIAIIRIMRILKQHKLGKLNQKVVLFHFICMSILLTCAAISLEEIITLEHRKNSSEWIKYLVDDLQLVIQGAILFIVMTLAQPPSEIKKQVLSRKIIDGGREEQSYHRSPRLSFQPLLMNKTDEQI